MKFNLSFLLGMLEAKASHERIYKYVKEGRAELRENLEQLIKKRGTSSYATMRIVLIKEILGE